ncbi:right-handed parallel beta-helix repeat-containing protein [Bacillus sp. FJAT-29937]|uniref:right-handed parallel beta-helix repeat-containing protein n=1 Tax=Bacillus sp. FJAT-29937 TaxID=1720553 RepID=UPI000834C98F|nr:right-handed parallel beta-helix repeat-containing protein [Bacillus sp. FJAT-29937]
MSIRYTSNGSTKVINTKSPANGTDDLTLKLQEAFDRVADGGTIIIDPGTYKVSKNTNLTGFPNNDQPCLLLRNKKNVRIVGYGAKLWVDQHAQGILEIQLSSNIIVEGLEIAGYGEFPAIDTTSVGYTGYGEKGTANGGYYTSGFWGYYKNNSLDTSKKSTHASINNGRPWGLFGNGGFIGNVSYGILIHNGSENIKLFNLDVHGFNYVGIGIGHNGNFVPMDLRYNDSKNILIQNCYVHDNYGANIHALAVDGVQITNCISERAGHPDSQISHKFIDPGYGVTLRGTNWSEAKNMIVQGSIFRDNKRKGIDSHTGIGMIFADNMIENSYACGIFAKWSHDLQQSQDIIIKGNKITNCSANGTGLGAIMVGGYRSGYSREKIQLHAIISDNLVKNCGATDSIIDAEVFDGLTITGNQIIGVDPRTVNTSFYGIRVGSSTSSQKSYSLNIFNNTIDAIGAPALQRGIQVSNVEDGQVNGNIIKLEHSNSNIGLYSVNNGIVNFIGNIVSMGSAGTPIAIAQTSGYKAGNISSGGDKGNIL